MIFHVFKKNGFTLFEITLMVALFFLISSATFSSLSTFLNRTYLDSTTQQMAQTFRFAQSHALDRYLDSPWGVHVDPQASQFIFFKGSMYDSRDPVFDESTRLPSSLALQNVSFAGGALAVVFDPATGSTAQYGSLDLHEVSSGRYSTIRINAYGQIDITFL